MLNPFLWHKMTQSTPKSEFIAGIKAMAPILLGIIPFGTISGIAAIDVGLSAGEAIAMSIIVFAGASQLAALQLIGVGTPILVTIFTAVVINLRMIVYSASLSPFFKSLSLRWKSGLSYLITDQAYAVSIARFTTRTSPHQHYFYYGAAISTWITWQLSTLAGIFLGAEVPPSWSLDFAIPLTFLAILIPQITDRATIVSALVAAIVVVVATNAPFHSSLMIAALTAIFAGQLFEKYQRGS